MHKIKEMLMKELYEYEEKAKKMSGGKMSAGDLETLHKLTDTVKNIDKIEMFEDAEGYSEDGAYMGEGRIYGTSYDDGSSYARMGRGRGRNAKRDSRGRYSSEGGMSYDYGRNYDDDMSFARGRGGNRGSSYRSYSYDGAKEDMVEKLEEMLGMAESEQERRAIQQCIQKLEQA
jgi:hypothetical protein